MPASRFPLIGFLLAAASPLSAVTLNQLNIASVEDFDTLAAVTGSGVPPGWEFSESGSGANSTYGAGTGSSSTGNTYSFGGSGSTDRAFGTLRTSSLAATLGTVITNQTGGAVAQLAIQYVGEQWRLGAVGRPDRLAFAYSLDATTLTTGTWLDVTELDFTGPVTSGALGALDGNAAENRVLVAYTLPGLSLANGASLWLRWSDFDATGSDDGLAIDNVSITAVGAAAEAVPDRGSTNMLFVGALGCLLIARARVPGSMPRDGVEQSPGLRS